MLPSRIWYGLTGYGSDLYLNRDRVVFGFVMRPMRFVPLLCYDSRDLSVCKLFVIFFLPLVSGCFAGTGCAISRSPFDCVSAGVYSTRLGLRVC